MDKKSSSVTLHALGESACSNGRVTFYADARSQRSQSDRRQSGERRKRERLTKDRRSGMDRRQQTMTWDNGYSFDDG